MKTPLNKSEQVKEIVKAYYPDGFNYHDEEAAVKVLTEVLAAAELQTLQKVRAVLKKRGQKVFTMRPTEFSEGKQAYATFVFNTIDRKMSDEEFASTKYGDGFEPNKVQSRFFIPS